MTETPSRKTAPYQVLLMFAILIATIALGFFMMPSSQEERDRLLGELGTTNHGTLLKPAKEITALSLLDENGAPWEFKDQKSKWRMLIIPAAGGCDSDCEQLLYLSRQVHVRLAKHSNRLERAFVATEGLPGPALSKEIADNHPHIRVLHTSAANLAAWLEGSGSRAAEGVAEVVLVDTSGLAMMVYDKRHDGNDMLEDISHLLKYSPQ